MANTLRVEMEPSGSGSMPCQPFQPNYARTIAIWSQFAALFVAAVLLTGGIVGLESPRLGPPLTTLAAFYLFSLPVCFHLCRERESWDHERDVTWARRILVLDMVTGVAVLYFTGGTTSTFLIIAPMLPFALRLTGSLWHTVLFAAVVCLGLAAAIIGQTLALTPLPGSVFAPANDQAAVEVMIGLTVVGGVILATFLANSIAAVLRRREAEAVAFSQKMNLRTQKLALLHEVGAALCRGSDFDEVAREALSRVHEHFEAEATVLYLLDRKSGQLQTSHALGEAAQREAQETSLALATLGAGQPRLWPSAVPGEQGHRSVMVAPLLVENTGYGAIKVVAPAGLSYNKSKLSLLETVALELGSTLRTAGNYHATNLELSRATQELAALNAFGRKLSSVFDLRAICQALLSTAVVTTRSDYANVTLFPRGSDTETVALFHNYPPEVEERLRSSSWRGSVGLYGRALNTRRPVLVNDVRTHGEYVPVLKGVRAKLDVPILVEGGVEGMVNLESKRPGAYTQGDLDFIAALAESTAIAIKNARLYRRLELTAVHDGLTGLYNHTYLQQSLEAEIDRCRRHGHPLSLVFFDVDDFKRYNDEHGHPAGDKLLRWIGRILRNRTRKSDVAARYGGEEFVIVMPDTTAGQALQAADKLRVFIETRQPVEGPHCITVSAGVASYPVDGETGPELIRTADERMYAAKKGGKNQVVAAG